MQWKYSLLFGQMKGICVLKFLLSIGYTLSFERLLSCHILIFFSWQQLLRHEMKIIVILFCLRCHL